MLAAIGVLDHFRALSALDQYLDGAVGELEQLQYARKRANLVDRLRCRIVVGRVLLGGEQDEGVGPHHLLEREDRLLASDEEGRDHVRKYDDVAQRQHRIGSGFTWCKQWAWLCSWPQVRIVVPRRRNPPVRSHDRVPMSRERNTGRRSDICAQRVGMIPYVPSQDLIRLGKLNDSPRLWVGNHQDSCNG